MKKFVKLRNKNTTINIATTTTKNPTIVQVRTKKSPLTVNEAKTYSLTKRHNKVIQLILA